MISVTHVDNATNYDNSMVNKNDVLEGLQIYNAKAQMLDGQYDVKVTGMDGTAKDFGTALYDSTYDRLVFTNKQDVTKEEIALPQVVNIMLSLKK